MNSVTTWTVLLSIVAHGMTARPGSNAYGAWAETNSDTIANGPESSDVPTDAIRTSPHSLLSPRREPD